MDNLEPKKEFNLFLNVICFFVVPVGIIIGLSWAKPKKAYTMEPKAGISSVSTVETNSMKPMQVVFVKEVSKELEEEKKKTANEWRKKVKREQNLCAQQSGFDLATKFGMEMHSFVDPLDLLQVEYRLIDVVGPNGGEVKRRDLWIFDPECYHHTNNSYYFLNSLKKNRLINETLYSRGELSVPKGFNPFIGTELSWTNPLEIPMPEEVKNFMENEINSSLTVVTENKIQKYYKNLRKKTKEKKFNFVVGATFSQSPSVISYVSGRHSVLGFSTFTSSIEINKKLEIYKVSLSTDIRKNPLLFQSSLPRPTDRLASSLFIGFRADFSN